MDLPLELRRMIFGLLPPRDLAQCRLICRQWNCEINSDPMLMRKIWLGITSSSTKWMRMLQDAGNGYIEFFTALIKFAPDPNPADKLSKTLLHYAAECEHLEVFRLIHNSVEDKNPADDEGETLLLWAALAGHLEVCRLILASVADKNPPCKIGTTPLHCAAAEGHLEVYRLILESVEDKNPVDDEGKTPLYGAAQGGHHPYLPHTAERERERDSSSL